MCKSKIKNARVTGKNMYYDGSLGIDKTIMKSAAIVPGEQVHVLNSTNGERFVTYAIEEKPRSGRIVLYGPAARLGEAGDELVILTYCHMDTRECHTSKLHVVALGKNNQCKSGK